MSGPLLEVVVVANPIPDLVIYLGPGIGLALIGLITLYLRRKR